MPPPPDAAVKTDDEGRPILSDSCLSAPPVVALGTDEAMEEMDEVLGLDGHPSRVFRKSGSVGQPPMARFMSMEGART